MLIILDLDNTITEYKKPITAQMRELILKLLLKHQVWIITSSSSIHARRQLGDLFVKVQRVYTSAGSELYIGGILVDFQEQVFPKPMIHSLLDIFRLYNLDIRTASINISLTGNNADSETKRAFAQQDKYFKFREQVANYLNNTFPDIKACVTGQTSVLIYKKGKEQIMDDIEDPHNTLFLGDEVDNGIDASLANALRAAGGKAINVDNPKHCERILNDEINFNRL